MGIETKINTITFKNNTIIVDGKHKFDRDDVRLEYYLTKIWDGTKYEYKPSFTIGLRDWVCDPKTVDSYNEHICEGGHYYVPYTIKRLGDIVTTVIKNGSKTEMSSGKNGRTKWLGNDDLGKLCRKKDLDELYEVSSSVGRYVEKMNTFSHLYSASMTGYNKYVRNVVVVDIDHNTDDGGCDARVMLDDLERSGVELPSHVLHNTKTGHYQLYWLLDKGVVVKKVSDTIKSEIYERVREKKRDVPFKFDFPVQSYLVETEYMERYKGLTKFLNGVLHGDDNFKMWRIKNPSAVYDYTTNSVYEHYNVVRGTDGLGLVTKDGFTLDNTKTYAFDELYSKYVGDIEELPETECDCDDTADDRDCFEQNVSQYVDVKPMVFGSLDVDAIVKKVRKENLGRECLCMSVCYTYIRKHYAKMVLDKGKTDLAVKDFKDSAVTNLYNLYTQVIEAFRNEPNVVYGELPGTKTHGIMGEREVKAFLRSCVTQGVSTYNPLYKGGLSYDDESRYKANMKKSSQKAVNVLLCVSYLTAKYFPEEIRYNICDVNTLKSFKFKHRLMKLLKSVKCNKLSNDMYVDMTRDINRCKTIFQHISLTPKSICTHILTHLRKGRYEIIDDAIATIQKAADDFDKYYADKRTNGFNFYRNLLSGNDLTTCNKRSDNIFMDESTKKAIADKLAERDKKILLKIDYNKVDAVYKNTGVGGLDFVYGIGNIVLRKPKKIPKNVGRRTSFSCQTCYNKLKV